MFYRIITYMTSVAKSGDTIPDSIEYEDNDSANQSRSTKLSKDQSYSNSADCERIVNYDSSSANYYSIVAAGSKFLSLKIFSPFLLLEQVTIKTIIDEITINEIIIEQVGKIIKVASR